MLLSNSILIIFAHELKIFKLSYFYGGHIVVDQRLLMFGHWEKRLESVKKQQCVSDLIKLLLIGTLLGKRLKGSGSLCQRAGQ